MIFLAQGLIGFVGETVLMKIFVNILTVSACQCRLKLWNIIKSGKTLFYSPDEIQERSSVLCGYWCLYYLFERQNGKNIFEVLHNPAFNPNNQMVNYEFIKKYFGIK